MSKYKDLQIYISSFESSPKIKYFKKNVFIGNPNLKDKFFFDVYIPTTTPGIDSEGLVVRSDGIKIIKLKKNHRVSVHRSIENFFKFNIKIK